MFHECILFSVSGLNRIARKLNIDCAPAMIGFDYHSGWSHPVYDGFVVCEEFKDTLIDAWNEVWAIMFLLSLLIAVRFCIS